MANNITSIKDLNKIIRDILIELSEINPNFVRHALTEYGVDLNKNTSASIFETINGKDTIILFDIEPESDSTSIMSEDKDSDTITYYMYFISKIIMYGDSSVFDSLKLTSKLRTEETRDELIEKGVHLVDVSNIRKHEEFVNGVIWMRNDFVIRFGCELSIDRHKKPYDIEGYSTIDIYTN